MNRSHTALGFALLCASCATPAPHPAAPEPTPKPNTPQLSAEPPVAGAATPSPLVVTIVVDQFAAWLASERLPKLPASGGFARLLREGTYVKELRYAHAITDTAPGHAALFTGAPPSVHGVFANQRVDRDSGAIVSITRDPTAKLVTASGVGSGPSASTRGLLAEPVADRLRATHPDALIVALSMKDRGAIFGAGRHPTACLWFDSKVSDFVSSDAFATGLPGWALGGSNAVRPKHTPSWQLGDGAWIQAHTNVPDAAPGEGALGGLTQSFPHAIQGADHPGLAFSVSPYGDEAVVDLAIAALGALPFGKQPGLLALSLSSTDYVGHVYGPDAWEWWDNFRRLDRELARLFEALDARVGAEGYAVVLSADHGTGVLPETRALPGARPWCTGSEPDHFERPCDDGGRIHLDRLVPGLEAAAKRSVGPGRWVLTAANPYVYLTRAALALPDSQRTRLTHALTAELERHPGIEAVIARPTEPCPPPEDESLAALVCRSFSPDAGELYVVSRPGWYLETGYVPGFGVNHGSHRLHDRSVPLLARAPGRIAASRVVTPPQSFAMFAQTVSRLLEIDAPKQAYAAPSALELR